MSERTQSSQLPRFFTSFVGRFRELQELSLAISFDSASRLVTVVGAGGCGKTRLATEAVLAIGPEYAGAAYFVELGEVQPESSVEQAVIAALGLQEYQDVAREESIALFVEKQQTLLVLDNCEHVIESVRRLCHFLLHRTSTLRILCTSRELLGICGELPLAIRPLPLPKSDEFDAFDPDESLSEAENSALRLFYDRARAVRPEFRISQKNVGSVARLCRLLDGLPLAIELAAARVRSFSPAEIAAHLENEGMSLLALRYSASLRHQTLDNAIAWSAEVLPEEERLLFQRLSIFRGGWNLAAAEEVCCDELLPPNQLLRTLGNLVDKSLVVTDHHSSRTRCRMLRTIHSYAERKLRQSSEYQTMVERHMRWVMGHSQRASRGLLSKDSISWIAALDEEGENYAAAMRAAVTSDPDYVARVVLNISRFWVRRQRITDMIFWTNAVLKHPRAAEHPNACGTAHYARGRMSNWLMNSFDSANHLAAAMALALECGDKELYNLCCVSALHSYPNAGRLDEVVEIVRTLESDGYAPVDPWSAANYALGRGMVACARNDYIAALDLFDQGVRGMRIIGESYLLAIALYQAGAAAQMAGELALARKYIEESNHRSLDLSFHSLVLKTQMRHAELLAATGDLPGALDSFDKLMGQLRAAGESPTAHVLRCLACIAIDAHMPEPAVLLYGAASMRRENDHALTTTGTIFHTPRIARARAALPTGAAHRLWEAGANMGIDEAIARALQKLRDPVAQSTWGGVPTLEINTLGPLRVFMRGEPIPRRAWKTSKSREMVALLATRGPMTKEKIGEALWNDKDRDLHEDGKASRIDNLFGATLSYLRATLGGADAVVLIQGRYQFNPSFKVRVDLAEFYRLKNAAFEHEQYEIRHAIALLEDALDLVTGAFLEDIEGGEWSEAERSLFEDQYCEALSTLGELSFERGNFARAEFAFGRMIEIDCMSEAAYRGLMRCYAARGDQVRLIRTYQRLEELMGSELGARPSPESSALYHRLFATFHVEQEGAQTASSIDLGRF